MWNRFVMLGLLAGCEKDLLADVHDAGIDTAAPSDAAPADSARCMTPATDASAAAAYSLFVNFDGVTLTPCVNTDARVNCTGLVQQDTVFPRFMDGSAFRDIYISTIVEAVRKRLAPYSVDVVTIRPAAGDYAMIVVGGSPSLIGAPPTIQGTSPRPCNADNRRNISIDFDRGLGGSELDYANLILGDTALLAGMGGAALNDDCLCRGLCTINANTLCTYGLAVPTDPQNDCGRPTQDEPALLQAVYGCR